MDSDWQIVLVTALALNAVLGFGYRVYRLGKGGPISDVWGQGVLGVLLLTLALAVGLGAGWARRAAGIYALLFGVVVMPLWLLAVFIPMRPRAIDYAFTGGYWLLLGVILVAAVLA
jgi:hypothetical protein